MTCTHVLPFQLRQFIVFGCLLLVGSVGLFGNGTASADTVITEQSASTNLIGGQPFAFGWSQTGTFNNVLIQADLGTNNDNNSSVTAYLTSQIGAGTTVAQELATAPVVVNFGQGTYNLFTGLTLGPGNYYVTVLPIDEITGLIGGGAPVSPTLGTGVSFLGDFTLGDDAYAPAGTASQSTFGFRYNVTGTLVPEPTSIGLLATGALVMGMIHRRRRSRMLRG